MANLICNGEFCARNIRPLAASLCIVLSAILFATRNSVHAAPVTFRFDAEITHVPTGTPFDLPFDFQVGDVVRGSVTFEPEVAPPGSYRLESLQTLGFQLDIDGIGFGSETYSIQSLNDSFIDDLFPFNVDTLTLTCTASSTRCSPSPIEVDGAEPFEMAFRMDLWGYADIVDAPSFASDATIWNDYDLYRRIIVYFGGIDSGGRSFHAVVRDFEVAPEPSTITSVCLIGATVASALLLKRKRHEVAL
jgi:hypothetical protein